MQFEFITRRFQRSVEDVFLNLNGHRVPLVFVRHARARRYVLRLRPDGSVRVTIPRGGSAKEARSFAERQTDWLERQRQRQIARPCRPTEWRMGSEILLRGEPVKIEANGCGAIGALRLGTEVVQVSATDLAADLRPAIECHLWNLAALELPPRALEYAARHQLPVRRITVRNQKTRWGSCSRHGTISLNWRLIQTPPHVRDYIILHELCHLREMNHSARFWREVGRVCPDFAAAERWLKQHATLLR